MPVPTLDLFYDSFFHAWFSEIMKNLPPILMHVWQYFFYVLHNKDCVV